MAGILGDIAALRDHCWGRWGGDGKGLRVTSRGREEGERQQRMWVSARVCAHACVHVCTCVRVCLCVHVCTRVRVHMCACVHMCV